MKILLTQNERELLRIFQELNRPEQERALQQLRKQQERTDTRPLYYRGYIPHYVRRAAV